MDIPRPHVLVISADERFRSQLARHLEETFTVCLRDGFDAGATCPDFEPPVALVIDARVVTDGGHAVAREIDARRQQSPQLLVVVLTEGPCPAALLQTVSAANVHLLRNIDSARPVAGFILATVSPTDRPIRPSAAKAQGLVAPVVLNGVSRCMETNSPRLRQMLEELAIAAAHDVTILLIGETGSGKTYLSRLIHEASPRRTAPFMHVSCGALPRELIESELFGHRKGSFTSAHADKEGKFVAAGKGTVFLDEIDALEPEQQVKLLRVIETGEFEPVGSNETLRSEARLVVASNLDLQPLVEQGRFRTDLYYRLTMLKFEIPPLRERRKDIVPLTHKFVQQFEEQHKIPVGRIDDELLDALLAYHWPGNVRELENVIQRAVIYCRDGRLTCRHLPPHIVEGAAGPRKEPAVADAFPACGSSTSLSSQVALTEREIIEQALAEHGQSRTRTARALGISRVTLYNKMKKYQLSRPAACR